LKSLYKKGLGFSYVGLTFYFFEYSTEANKKFQISEEAVGLTFSLTKKSNDYLSTYSAYLKIKFFITLTCLERVFVF